MQVICSIEDDSEETQYSLSSQELNQVSGGLAFLPALGLAAGGSFVGGYIAGKIWNAFQA